MADEWGQRSEYYDDGVRFGTGPEMIAEIKRFKSSVTNKDNHIFSLEHQVEAKDARIAELEATVAKLEEAECEACAAMLEGVANRIEDVDVFTELAKKNLLTAAKAIRARNLVRKQPQEARGGRSDHSSKNDTQQT